MDNHTDLLLLAGVKCGDEGCLSHIEEKYQVTAYRILVDFLGSEETAQSLLPQVFSHLYRTVLEEELEESADVSIESLVHRASYDVALDSVTMGFSRTPLVPGQAEGEEGEDFPA